MTVTLKPWQLVAISSILPLCILITQRINHAIFLKRKRELAKLEQELAALKQLQQQVDEEVISDTNNLQINNDRIKQLDRVCFIKSGVLTHIDEQECELDFEWKFSTDLLRTQWTKDFDKGCTLKYLAYRGRRDSKIEIIKVLSIEGEIWDTKLSENQLQSLVAKHKNSMAELIETEVIEMCCRVVDSLEAQQQITLSYEGNRYNVQLAKVKNLQLTPKVADYVDIIAVFCNQIELLEVLCIKASTVQRDAHTQDINADKIWVDVKFQALPAFQNKFQTQILQIFLTNKRGAIILQRIGVLGQRSGQPHAYIKLLKPELYENGYKLEKHAEHMIELIVESQAEKSEMLSLELQFEKFKLKRTFLVVNKYADEIKPSLDNNKKYTHAVLHNGQRRTALPAQSQVEKRRFIANKIEGYELPEDLENDYFQQPTQQALNEYLHLKYAFLGDELNMQNYRKRFQLLLHLEELAIFEGFRQYDCQAAKFLKAGEFLSLLIDNLSERRPSLVVGDLVRVLTTMEHDKHQNMCVDGYIHKVMQDRILIKFNEHFHACYNDEAYDLEFHFSRYVFRKMHHAVALVAKRQPSYLFPETLLKNPALQLSATLEAGNLKVGEEICPWFKDNLNLHQKRAVCQILQAELSMPYCIFGPPGTGKTVTVVETILQLRQHLPKSHILIAAPSNSAADIIAQRLLQHQPDIQFLRVVSFMQVENEAIPTELLKYCATVDVGIDRVCESKMIQNEQGIILHCTSTYLSYFSIVIGTCTTLGTLLQIRFPVNHFTHAVIDEAAQCQEPELMCVASLLAPSGKLIIAGDPQQLPPMVQNMHAQDAGLAMSYMERILKLLPYQKNKLLYPDTSGFDARLITMLIYNYRALPSILKVYNDLFYERELIAVLEQTDEQELQFLQTGQAAIKEIGEVVNELPALHATYFCGLKGVNMKKADSPSWYNELEAKYVYLTTMALLARGIRAEHIGIISPYQKQVRFIRSLFMDNETEIPKIGSIEEFQGQERHIILISTVRTVETYVDEDLRQFLGFLRNPRRMNVAISRARSLVIVFGNPLLLCSDENWLTYIKYCYYKNTCYGDNASMTFLNEFMIKL